jgi:methionyl-tRNA formyltransferase
MNGASITGVTTMQMNEMIDAGDILLHQEEPINEDDTTGTLRERLAHIGARLLRETLDTLEAGGVESVPQEEDYVTYAPPIRPDEGNIDWGQPAQRIDRLVRALAPAPGAYTFFRGKRLKIWSVQVTDVPPEDEPGTLMNMGKEGFLVNTGTSCLWVATLQPEGKQRMTAGEFSRGQRLLIAESFTDGPLE